MKYPVLLGLTLSVFLLFSCGGGEEADDSAAGAEANGTDAAVERTVPPNPVEVVNEDGVIVTHALSLRSQPKYPADFDHFDYVNPDAPKGGSLTLAFTGTFDNFHRYAQRGDSVPGGSLFYDTLITGSADEVEVYYGLVAEKMEYSPEYDWIIYHIRPEARHQDGKPIVAEDVVFSFYKFFNEGVSQFRSAYENVTSVEALDERRVKFTLAEGDKDMLINVGGTTILPPQFWEGRDFSEPLQEPPLGSGAYRVSDFSMGQYVVWERIPDYWAMDIPPIRGQLNFDFIRYDAYRDQTVQLEALKAGEIDMHYESIAKNWATAYTGPNVENGYIIQEMIPDETPATIQRYIYNTQRPYLSDRRVREAIGYMMDFEWMNKNLFYDQYTRERSYFQGTPFEAMGLPSEEELEILEPIRDQIPGQVFTEEYNPPVNDGSGIIRGRITEAKALFDEAGWEIRDQVMVNKETGEPFVFEMLIYTPSGERPAIPMQENLKKLGITMDIRLVDTSQYINRIRELDFDLISWPSSGAFYPSTGLQISWHSDYIDSTWNLSGVSDPAIDYLIEGIVANQNDNQELLWWGRAFDRVVQWNHYSIYQWHLPATRIAYWDRFSRPETKPKYSDGTETWWYDEEKASALSR